MDLVKPVVAAVVQVLAAVLGLLTLVGVVVPADVIDVIGVNLEKLLGGLIALTALMPSIYGLVKQLTQRHEPPQ